MSDKRKLFAEVDRTLKKIQEGMDIFDEIWEKVQEAPTQSHKEKCEQDLKKEIKKLQRLRDQVKTWIASNNEIKDKEPLLKARRDIETKMEKFKDVERETKTKVYSKVGLAQAAKMDINQKKKHEAWQALSTFIDQMNCDLEQFDSELEDMEAGSKKKKLEKDKQEKMEFLRTIVEAHRGHITKMETMLRMLDNDSLEAETVEGITDDIKFYLEKSDEGIFEDIAYIYEGIDLEETIIDSPSQSPEPSITSKDSDDVKKLRPNEPVTPVFDLPKPSLKILVPGTSTAAKLTDIKTMAMSPPPIKTLSQSLPNAPAQPPLLQAYAAAAAKALPSPQVGATKQPLFTAAHTVVEEAESSASAPAKKLDQERPQQEVPPPPPTAPVPQASTMVSEGQARRPSNDFTAAQTPLSKATTPLHFPLSASPRPPSYASSMGSGSVPTTPQAMPMKDPWKDAGRNVVKPVPVTQNGQPRPDSSQQFTAQPVPPSPQPQLSTAPPSRQAPSLWPVQRSDSERSSATPIFMNASDSGRNNAEEKTPSFSVGHSRNASDDLGSKQQQQAATDLSAARSLASPSPALSLRNASLMADSQPTTSSVPLITKAELEARITPMMAMVPLGPERPTRDMLLQHNCLDAAFNNPPKPCDSERRKTFIPCIQCQIPQGWPRQPPMPLVCDMKFYSGLANDALFFIFYYEEGSLAQVLAAKTLKSKNWRFHKQLNAWFQRLDEPKVTTTDYERGNYKYWDLESWTEKTKSDFTFEYRYLENVDLNRWPYV
ncbi:CCR4-NOT transcription complex subunit 3 [Hypsibius exemplaris]|uniref:CCR4-NOT transcription complex subunit 3 n=1 Tax=Hypsibius exemplaris TaxID=2072580 RepID=A0A1W0W899_HYPEX|nr:CCR4-NOT transcription complex subunit 3 [Hypsibius exemplaris]